MNYKNCPYAKPVSATSVLCYLDKAFVRIDTCCPTCNLTQRQLDTDNKVLLTKPMKYSTVGSEEFGNKYVICPNCDVNIDENIDHCPYCGQAIWWDTNDS